LPPYTRSQVFSVVDCDAVLLALHLTVDARVPSSKRIAVRENIDPFIWSWRRSRNPNSSSQNLDQTGTVASRFVRTEAANADWRAHRNVCDELNRLVASKQ
jgi:hypothetical protein